MHPRQKEAKRFIYPELLIDEVTVEVVDNVGILVFPHDKDLVDDEFLLGLLRQVHLFDGHFPTSGHLNSNVNCTRCSVKEI